MISTSLEQEAEVTEFVKKAKEAFLQDKEVSTFGNLEKGSLLAMRWGLMDRGIVVVRLDSDFEPINFRDAIVENKS
jgi:hypothetical protein